LQNYSFNLTALRYDEWPGMQSEKITDD
jgi:hypothetical protein